MFAIHRKTSSDIFCLSEVLSDCKHCHPKSRLPYNVFALEETVFKILDIAVKCNIKRTVSRIPNPDTSAGQPRTILYIRTPKSHTSSREIPIPGYLINALKRLRKGDDLYVLTGRSTCTEPRNVQKRFKTILKRCEMEDCNFHAMRHGFATACLENGVDCKTVSAILGHASIRTTMDFYVHTSMRQKKDCIDGID